MSKKIIIISLLLVLLTPLFARGAAEEISESGVHGLFTFVREITGLPSLGTEEEPAARETEGETKEEEKLLLTETFSYRGFEASLEGYSKHAVVTLPEGPSEDDVRVVMKKALSDLGVAEIVTFEIEKQSLVIHYPEQNEESLRSLYEALASYLEALIDSLTPPSEPEVAVVKTVAEPVAEAPVVVVEEAVSEGVVADDGAEKPYKVSFSYRGIKTDIEGYRTYTNVYIPLGVTKADVQGVVAFMLEKDSAFLLRSFKIDGAKVVFTYSEQSAEKVIEAVDSLREYLKAYIDSIFDKAQPVQSAVSTGEKVEALEFTFGIDMGIRGKFKYEKDTTHIFPSATARADLVFYSCFFIEANAQIMVYRSNSYLLVVGAAEALGGMRIGNDTFNFFGFGGARYTLSTKNSGFSGGLGTTFGGGVVIGLGKYMDVKAVYEHFNDDDYFNVSLGFRF